jgi:threonine synthase
MSYMSHLTCAKCGAAYPAGRPHNLCRCGSPLLAVYDLESARAKFQPEVLRDREPTMWRYREVLPVADPAHVVSLGEGFTPLVHARRLGSSLGLTRLYIKEEGGNPTVRSRREASV